MVDPRIAAALAAEQAGDVDGAVEAWDAAVAAAPVEALVLDAAARARWRRSRDDDLADAAALWRRAVAALPADSEARCAILNNLGVALRELWERDREPELLNEAVSVALEASQAAAADAPDGATARLQLGKALRARYRATHHRDDLEAAITATAQAGLALREADVPEAHEQLGNALLDRYRLTREDGDLKDAVASLARAAELDDENVVYRGNLASALLDRYERKDRRADLDEAFRLLDPLADDASSELLTTLGDASRMRAALDGDLEDADRAVELLAQAADLEDDKRGNLSAALLERYDLTGRIEDLDEAIRTLDAVLADTPDTDPGLAARLSNLGIALRARQLRRPGDGTDVDRAIEAFERALALTGDEHADAPGLHANLGNALHQRHDIKGDRRDLDRAVEEAEAALATTPDESADRAMYLNNLSASLSARAEFDRGRAVALAADAVQRTPRASARRATYLINLGNAQAEQGDGVAVDTYRDAVATGLLASPADALGAAVNWSEWARGRASWDEVVDACSAGMSAARTLLATQLLRADKESWLRDAQGLTVDGAYALIATARAGEAPAVLEGGRTLLMAERLAIDTTDLDRLAAAKPDLRARLDAAVAAVRRLEAAV